MRWIEQWLEKLRKSSNQNSCTCDACGKEVFSYPEERLCKQCAEKIIRNSGFQCEKCGRACRGAGICNTCKVAVPQFEKAASALVYFDWSAMLVNSFKNGKRYLSYFFADELAAVLSRLPKKEYVLVAVPLSKQKLRARGYNQSAELVHRLSELTGLEARVDLLEKRGADEQKQLSAKERRKNVKGAFRVTDKSFCKGKDLLIIDDVMTSGATMSEIASVLLRAGAQSVCAASVSAVPDRD